MTILSELTKFSYCINIPPSAYAESTVYWLIILNADGSFNRVQELNTSQPNGKGKEKKPKPGRKILSPHIRRNAIQPKLITDTIEYVLGDKDKANAYRSLLNRCYEATQEPAVKAILNFLASKPTLNIDPEQAVTFSINGVPGYIHDLPSVQKFWAQYADEITGGNRPIMQCLVTGEELPVTTKFALQVKGIPGVNPTGGSLVSAYLDSCSSYGLSGALTSPISVDADERFSQALSYLLRKPEHRLNIGSTTFVFWADSEAMTKNIYEDPDAKDVQDYLNLFSPRNHTYEPDWEFNILALSGNGGRLVVRDWIHGKEPEFVQHYEQWLKSQEVLGWNAFDNRGHLGIWQLACAGYRESKEIQTQTVIALMRNAVYGENLPIGLIQRVCTRNRIEQKVTYSRAVILHMYCQGLKLNYVSLGGTMTDEEAIAFHYGRLLATYAQLQRAAQNTNLANTNAMKCYPTAGFSPIPMSHRLASGAKNHLAVLSGGLQHWYSQKLAQINEMIVEIAKNTDIPTVFSINAQAHFDLGCWSELNSKSESNSKKEKKQLSEEIKE